MSVIERIKEQRDKRQAIFLSYEEIEELIVEIDDLMTDRYDDGYRDGRNEGYDCGYEDGYDTGSARDAE